MRETGLPETLEYEVGDHVAIDRFPSPNKQVQSRAGDLSERLASPVEGRVLSHTGGRRRLKEE